LYSILNQEKVVASRIKGSGRLAPKRNDAALHRNRTLNFYAWVQLIICKQYWREPPPWHQSGNILLE
jgi:hypothetical protein